jgi:FixJ family two-component response regulator
MGQKASRQSERESRENPLITIIDDDDLMRTSTGRLLSSVGYRSVAFASAEEFIQSGRSEETDCLLLDVKMPGMDGLELQRLLNETGRRVPIIFISAPASEEEERRALEAGASSFLRKPTSKEVLLEALNHALRPRD